MISIRYAPQPQHWRWVIRRTYERRTVVLRTAGLTLIVVSAIALAIPITAWPLAVVGACILVSPDVLLWLALRRLPRQLAFGEREVRLSDSGVEVVTRGIRCTYDAEIISGTNEVDEGWIIMVESQPAIVIPRDVVPEDEAAAIGSLLDEYKKRSPAAAQEPPLPTGSG